jgi:hypothetical protein
MKNGVGWCVEALIVSFRGTRSHYVDFLCMAPRGKFYLLRILQDDLTDKVLQSAVPRSIQRWLSNGQRR